MTTKIIKPKPCCRLTGQVTEHRTDYLLRSIELQNRAHGLLGGDQCPFPEPEKRLWSSTHTLVELAPLAPSDKALAVRVPGHAGQAVLMRLGHLCP